MRLISQKCDSLRSKESSKKEDNTRQYITWRVQVRELDTQGVPWNYRPQFEFTCQIEYKEKLWHDINQGVSYRE